MKFAEIAFKKFCLLTQELHQAYSITISHHNGGGDVGGANIET